MNTWVPALIVVMGVVILGFLIFQFVSFGGDAANIPGYQDNSQEARNVDDGETPNVPIGGLRGSDSSGGGGDPGSGPGGDTGGGSNANCQMQQLSYSIVNFNKNSTCNQQDGNGFCIDKNVICSVEVNNLDNSEGGIFSLLFSLAEEGLGVGSAFDTEQVEYSLIAGEERIFKSDTQIQTSGEEGLANKNIDCFYNTLQIPQKEVCQ